MKQLAITILSFISFSSFAQNGLFIGVEGGMGTSNTSPKNQPLRPLETVPAWMAYLSDAKKISSYNGGVSVGYRLRNWELTTGASILTSGYTQDYSWGDFVFVRSNVIQSYSHVQVPLTLGYKIKIVKGLFVTPTLGAALSYNCAAYQKTTDDYYGTKTVKQHTLTDDEFNAMYTRNSAWGVGKIQLGYNLNKRLSVSLRPEAQFMLTPLTKSEAGGVEVKNYVFSCNAGITWALSKGK